MIKSSVFKIEDKRDVNIYKNGYGKNFLLITNHEIYFKQFFSIYRILTFISNNSKYAY